MNRMIIDPLINLAGACVVRRVMYILMDMHLFIFIWLLIQIFASPVGCIGRIRLVLMGVTFGKSSETDSGVDQSDFGQGVVGGQD